jgi:coproporphyrinogen III oxidase
MTDWQPFTARAKQWFEDLRDRICAEFEAIETRRGSDAKFDYLAWERQEAGNAEPGGGMRGLMKGQVFEKVGVNVSTVAASSRPSSRARCTAPRTIPVSPPPASAWSRTWPTRTCPRCT